MKQFCFLIFSILSLRQGAQAQSRDAMTPHQTVVLENRSFTERNANLSYDWKTELAGQSTTGETQQSKLADFRLDFKVLYTLNSYLNLDFQPIVKFQSSNQQTLDAADAPDNKLLLYQAAVNFKPIYFFTLSAGALNQGPVHTSLLIDDIPFPGARADFAIYTSRDTSLDLFAETAIPATSSLSPNTNDIEPTPSLNSVSLKFRTQSAASYSWTTSAGYFAYSQLPSAVAAQSYLLGNTVQLNSPNEGVFKYQYQGYEAKTKFKLTVMRGMDLFVGGEYLQNSKAPSSLNTGSLFFAGTDIFLRKGLSVMVSGGYFRIEPDAAVAYFAPQGYFNTNRVGYMAETYLNFKRESFRLGLRYSEAEAMYISPVQNRERALLLRLETTYADDKG